MYIALSILSRIEGFELRKDCTRIILAVIQASAVLEEKLPLANGSSDSLLEGNKGTECLNSPHIPDSPLTPSKSGGGRRWPSIRSNPEPVIPVQTDSLRNPMP